MDSRPSITNVNDDYLIDLIKNASRRIVYMAPGVSDDVAKALAEKWNELRSKSVCVILDTDPEVCRLGYGTLQGLKEVQQTAEMLGTQVGHQPGVRIGLLISDDTTLIFSPTPLLIEAGSGKPERPNAIQLDVPPMKLAKEIGLGERPDIERTVGRDPIDEIEIKNAEADLAKAPPQKFDLARRVHVFNSHFQFVELSSSNCFISRKKIKIPSNLVGLANNRDIERQFHAHFDFIPKGKLKVNLEDDKGNCKVISEQSIQDKIQSIKKGFLTVLTGYGSVILRANREKFDQKIKELIEEVNTFSEGIKDELKKHIKETIDAIVDALLPSVNQNLPDEYTKIHGPNPPEDHIRQLLTQDISKAFGKNDNMVQPMQVKVIFKEVAYESLIDNKFLEIARKVMPGIDFLHTEFDAARSKEI